LATGLVHTHIITPLSPITQGSSSLTYPSSASFDSSTKISVCSGPSGENSIECEIKSLKVWFTSNQEESKAYLYGVYPPIALAQYQMTSASDSIENSLSPETPLQFGKYICFLDQDKCFFSRLGFDDKCSLGFK